MLENFVFVTDNGSNMVSALQNFHRLPCACHMLATVLTHTLPLHALSKTVPPLSCDDPDVALDRKIQITVSSVKSLTA